jgi:hypothetical protein
VSDLRTFGRQLDEIAERIGESPKRLAIKITFDAFRGVTARTPVREGRARSSWNIAEGKADESVASEIINRAVQEVGTPRRPSLPADLPQFPEMHISNNLPYIEALEDGHSKQTLPLTSGTIVEITLAEIDIDMQNKVREVERSI